jgi:hypothetical protein
MLAQKKCNLLFEMSVTIGTLKYLKSAVRRSIVKVVAEKIREAKTFLENLPPEEIAKQVMVATQSSSAKQELQELEGESAKLKNVWESTQAQVSSEILSIKENASLSGEDRAALIIPLQASKQQAKAQWKAQAQLVDIYQETTLHNCCTLDDVHGSNLDFPVRCFGKTLLNDDCQGS